MEGESGFPSSIPPWSALNVWMTGQCLDDWGVAQLL